jgi:ribonuclease D
MWQTRNPLGYARLTHARAAISELALIKNMPAENLISPEAIRRTCWPNPPEDLDDRERFVVSELSEFGARPWQVALVLGPITAILSETEPLIVEVPPEEVTEGESLAPESD